MRTTLDLPDDLGNLRDVSKELNKIFRAVGNERDLIEFMVYGSQFMALEERRDALERREMREIVVLILYYCGRPPVGWCFFAAY